MNKEIEDAIERLNGIDIKFFLAANIEQSNYIIETADKINNAIETALNYIKDSTPNSAIREKIEELKNKSGGNVFHIQQTINAEIRLLEEMLKEGEK